jgi:hypothetical protein
MLPSLLYSCQCFRENCYLHLQVRIIESLFTVGETSEETVSMKFLIVIYNVRFDSCYK